MIWVVTRIWKLRIWWFEKYEALLCIRLVRRGAHNHFLPLFLHSTTLLVDFSQTSLQSCGPLYHQHISSFLYTSASMPFGKIYTYPVRVPALSVTPFSHFGFFNYLRHYCLINIFQILPQNNPRTTVLLAVAKANGLEIETVHEEPSKGVSDEYLKINPLGKVPTFQGEDGFILSECIAIAIYRKYLQPNTLPLYNPLVLLAEPDFK